MTAGLLGVIASSGSGSGGSGITTDEFVIFWGQSNMAGFGAGGAEALPSELAAGTYPNVKKWNGSSFVAFDPVDGSNGLWGPYAQFCREWSDENPTHTLYVLYNALGGAQLQNTTIEKASGAPDSDWSPTSTGELFAAVESAMTSAWAAATGLSANVKFTGIIGYQGEGDASIDTGATNFYANKVAFRTACRTRWAKGANAAATKFVDARIGAASFNPQYTTVPDPLPRIDPRPAKLYWAWGKWATEDAYTYVIPTEDLSTVEGIHLGTASAITCGSRLYAAYRRNFPYVNPALPATFSFSTPEQPSSNTLLGTITPTAGARPMAFEIVSGDSDGIEIDAVSGKLFVTNSGDLAYADGTTRVFGVRAYGGRSGAVSDTTVTLTLTNEAATDVANRVFVLDPNDATKWTLSGSDYNAIADAKGSGRSLGKNLGSAPSRTTFPGTSRYGMEFVHSAGDGLAGAGWGVSDPYLVAGVTDSATFYGIVRFTDVSTDSAFDLIWGWSNDIATNYALIRNRVNGKLGYVYLNAGNQAVERGDIEFTPLVNTTYRIRLTRVGGTIQCFVNDVEQTISLPSMKSWLIGSSGTAGNMGFGTVTPFGGPCPDMILGKCWVVAGGVSAAEVTFMKNDLLAWLA